MEIEEDKRIIKGLKPRKEYLHDQICRRCGVGRTKINQHDGCISPVTNYIYKTHLWVLNPNKGNAIGAH